MVSLSANDYKRLVSEVEEPIIKRSSSEADIALLEASCQLPGDPKDSDTIGSTKGSSIYIVKSKVVASKAISRVKGLFRKATTAANQR